MGAVLVATGGEATVTVGQYTAFVTRAVSGATESTRAIPYRIAGTFSKLTGHADNVGTGRNIKLRVNSADGASIVTFADTTDQTVTDSVNTDHINVGDTIDLIRNGSS